MIVHEYPLPHFIGGSQKCTQGTTLVKARNGKKLKMLNLKFAWISDPAANTKKTAVYTCIHVYMVVSPHGVHHSQGTRRPPT